VREVRCGARNVAGKVERGLLLTPYMIRRCRNSGKSPFIAASTLLQLVLDVVREIRPTRLRCRRAKSRPSPSSAVISAFWLE